MYSYVVYMLMSDIANDVDGEHAENSVTRYMYFLFIIYIFICLYLLLMWRCSCIIALLGLIKINYYYIIIIENTTAVFVDLQQAYDRVWRKGLLYKM